MQRKAQLEVVWETGGRSNTYQARSLLCYWASKELGLSMPEIANRLSLMQPTVGVAVKRGEYCPAGGALFFKELAIYVYMGVPCHSQ